MLSALLNTRKINIQYMEHAAQRWPKLYRGKDLGVRLIKLVQDRN
jgi:hypothetical protein